jgi:hypothetical protein
MLVDSFAEQSTRLKVWYILSGDINRITGLRVTTTSWHSITKSNTAETPDLDSIPGDQRLAHPIENGVYRKLNVPRRQMRLIKTKALDQFRLRHRSHRIAFSSISIKVLAVLLV